ncbi:MAG: adenylate/guanylate cyclase domain-containing protein [Pyrinomonadaceae bacterium]
MLKLFNNITSTLFGDPRTFPLEHRLFNTVTLLSGVSNVGGTFALVNQPDHMTVLVLNLGTGLVFLLLYYLSRRRGWYQHLYWPFVLMIIGFLFINSMKNAGTQGGAHYYFIAGLVMAVVLSGKARRTVAAIFLFGVATVTLAVIEYQHPEWITAYSNDRERFLDVMSNLLFALVFTGVIVQVLAQNLNQERRNSDQLLRNVLPESVALELKRTERVQPVHYESASVLFTDFVGFTQIAENFTPEELVAELDTCFSQFDQITKRHGLEKIKTIGDAYLAVGGVPQANQSHAVDCVRAALEIQQLIAGWRENALAANRPYWQVRIGIHSGDLVAGVVGTEKFAYDVWGDTVNTASRLESSGVAGHVNISRATYELVKGRFDCEYRGRVTAKNKGEIDMYFVQSVIERRSARNANG